MSNHVVISKVNEGYGMSHIDEGQGKTFVFEGKYYNHFYREFVDLKQGFYVQEGIDEIEATDIWYKTIGIHI